jgi:hypothetical protein
VSLPAVLRPVLSMMSPIQLVLSDSIDRRQRDGYYPGLQFPQDAPPIDLPQGTNFPESLPGGDPLYSELATRLWTLR